MKSREKAIIIWGWERFTAKSLRSQEVSLLGLPKHSWNLKLLSKKVLMLTDIDFPNLEKNTISWKHQVKGNGKHTTFKKKMKEMWKLGKPFSGQWNVAIMQWFTVWNMSDQVLDPNSLCWSTPTFRITDSLCCWHKKRREERKTA